jgi:hypothetical protein
VGLLVPILRSNHKRKNAPRFLVVISNEDHENARFDHEPAEASVSPQREEGWGERWAEAGGVALCDGSTEAPAPPLTLLSLSPLRREGGRPPRVLKTVATRLGSLSRRAEVSSLSPQRGEGRVEGWANHHTQHFHHRCAGPRAPEGTAS